MSQFDFNSLFNRIKQLDEAPTGFDLDNWDNEPMSKRDISNIHRGGITNMQGAGRDERRQYHPDDWKKTQPDNLSTKSLPADPFSRVSGEVPKGSPGEQHMYSTPDELRSDAIDRRRSQKKLEKALRQKAMRDEKKKLSQESVTEPYDPDYGPYTGHPMDPRTPEPSEEELMADLSSQWIRELEDLDLDSMSSIEDVPNEELKSYLQDIIEKNPKFSLEQVVLTAIEDLNKYMDTTDADDDSAYIKDSVMNNEIPKRDVEECGDSMPQPSQQSQQDSVNMSVNINGSGAGGIRNILDILKKFDGTDHTGHDRSAGEPPHGKQALIDMGDDMEEELANTPHPTVMPVSSVLRTGNDIHSKGKEAPKVNGGGNPMQIKARLESLYSKIKGE